MLSEFLLVSYRSNLLSSEFFNSNLIALLIFGTFGFNVLYNYEKFKKWNIFSLERKFDRLRIVFSGLWIVISCKLYIFTNDFRWVDFLNDWGTREWRVFNTYVVIFTKITYQRLL